jgi:hypothetical protein
MAVRRPLVVISGEVKELPVGDSLDSAETVERFAVSVASKNYEVVFSKDGDVVNTLERIENV